MELSIFDLPIARIASIDQLQFKADAYYLWVIHANKIPPHLGVSDGAHFFSLKANGKDEGLKVSKILSVLQKKKIATVFYEIPRSQSVKSVVEAFELYSTTIPEEVTCLQPIKDLFQIENARWLKEFLDLLADRNGIIAAQGWLLPDDFEGIPNYNSKDINDRLIALANV